MDSKGSIESIYRKEALEYKMLSMNPRPIPDGHLKVQIMLGLSFLFAVAAWFFFTYIKI